MIRGSCHYIHIRLEAGQQRRNFAEFVRAIAVGSDHDLATRSGEAGTDSRAQAAIYLATAPKSNAVYLAYGAAAADAHRQAADPVPLHLRNAPTKLMKDLDYGKDYQYAHDEPDAIAGMDCLPPSLADRTYYKPTDRGFEKEIKRRLDGWEKIKQERRTKG